MSTFTLRPYQREAIQNVRTAWDAGANNVLIVLATGLGKTSIFTSLGDELRKEGMRKILVLAHRRELVHQAKKRWEQTAPGESVGVYMGSRKETYADVIVGSVASCYPDRYETSPCGSCGVQGEGDELLNGPGCDACGGVGETKTLVRRGRLNDLPLGEIDLVIVDEAHHITRDSQYMAVLDAIRKKNPSCLLLMLTATPFRRDGRGFGWLVNDIPFVMGINAGIEGGWLAPWSPDCHRLELHVDLSQIKCSKSTGDFDDDALGEALDTNDARKEIVKAWETLVGPGAPNAPALGRKTVVFCPTVAFAEHLCEAFSENGHPAGWICSDTKLCKKDHRNRMLNRYAAGELRVMVNVGILTEGWDDPETSCILIARPTKSNSLYVQMVGRGTRIVGLSIEESTKNGKADCLVIDCVGASALGLASIADMSMDPVKEDVIRDLIGEDEEEPEPEVQIEFPEEPTTIEVNGHSLYRIDLFSGRISWTRLQGVRVACMSPGRAVVIFEAGDGTYSACASGRNAEITWVAQRANERDALKAAEIYALQNGSEQWLKPNTFVVRRPVSASQKAHLARLIRWTQRDMKRIGSTRPIGIDMAGIDRLSMAEASAWAAYLEVKLAFARASAAA